MATEYLQTHFRDVANTEEFLEQPPDRLCELLAMEKLNVGNEKHVLEAVVRWIGHDTEARRVSGRVLYAQALKKLKVVLLKDCKNYYCE